MGVLIRRFWWLAAVATLGAAAAVATMYFARTAIPRQVLHELLTGLSFALVIMALGAVIGTWALHHDRRRTAMHVLALATVIAWQLLLVSAQSFVELKSAAPVARIIAPLLGPRTEVFSVRTYLRGLPFYLGRLVTVVDHHRDDLAPGLASHPQGYIADVATFERRWRASDDAIALAAEDQIPQLRADGLPFGELGRGPTGVVITRHDDAVPLRTTP